MPTHILGSGAAPSAFFAFGPQRSSVGGQLGDLCNQQTNRVQRVFDFVKRGRDDDPNRLIALDVSEAHAELVSTPGFASRDGRPELQVVQAHTQ